MPFAVTFDQHGNLLVAEAAGALASFQIDHGRLALAARLGGDRTGGHLLGRRQPTGSYYTSNAGSATLTGFGSELGGQLLTRLGNTPDRPGHRGRGRRSTASLYVQGGKEGTVDEFRVQPDGSLADLGSVLVPGAEGGEGIVAD